MNLIDIKDDNLKNGDWKIFLILMLSLIFIGILILSLMIILINPYNNLYYSLNKKRERVTGNERYALTTYAKDKKYDSALFGTSTTMLLKPSLLNKYIDGKFINFSMGSATAHEQLEMLLLFLRHHENPKNLVIGIDVSWCTPDKNAEKFTFRPFPPWQYDNNVFNDYLYLLNTRSIIHSLRLLRIWAGLAQPAYDEDGYYQFVPNDSDYDYKKALNNLYEKGIKRSPNDIKSFSKNIYDKPGDWTFPDLKLLTNVIVNVSDETKKIFMFVPYHFTLIDNENSWKKYLHCKNEVIDIASKLNNSIVLDYLYLSNITTTDSNYWDPLHHKLDTSKKIMQSMSTAINFGSPTPGQTRILWPK